MGWTPLIDQMTLTPLGSEDCFETVLAMTLQHLGHAVAPAAILAVHAGSTELTEGLALCRRFGLKGCRIVMREQLGGRLPDLTDAIAAILFHDNPYARPDVQGSLLHYGAMYAEGGGLVHVANPYPGVDAAYSLASMQAAWVGAIMIPVSINRASPVPVPHPEADMNNVAAGQLLAEIGNDLLAPAGVPVGTAAELTALLDADPTGARARQKFDQLLFPARAARAAGEARLSALEVDVEALRAEIAARAPQTASAAPAPTAAHTPEQSLPAPQASGGGQDGAISEASPPAPPGSAPEPPRLS